jgi:DNA-binding NarL/FixJ family response regulator
MKKIFIADDHEVVREGLKRIIGKSGDMVVAGESNDGRDALRKILAGSYDVIVLDIAMPGISGLDVLREVKERKPHLPVLILSMYPEEQFAVRAIKAGAIGYLAKSSIALELVTAIRSAILGKRYVSESLAIRLADALGESFSEDPHQRLTDREFEVFIQLSRGRYLKEIASNLHISEKTVSTYRRRILDKMGLDSNAELVRYAVERNLVE